MQQCILPRVGHREQRWTDGPAAAIDVCKSEAPAMAEQVKRDFSVNTGRTSFKLRNSMNPSTDWAHKFVTERADSPRLVALTDDALGVFLPIRLQKRCLLCDGPADRIADDVQAALKLHCPNGQNHIHRHQSFRKRTCCQAGILKRRKHQCELSIILWQCCQILVGQFFLFCFRRQRPAVPDATSPAAFEEMQ